MTWNRIYFMLKNHLDAAVSLTSGVTEPAGMEVANLKDPDRTKIYGASATSTFVEIQLSGTPMVQGFLLTNLDYSFKAAFRLRGHDQAADWANAKFDTGASYLPAYPSALGFGSGAFGKFGFGGFINKTDSPYYRPTLAYFMTSVQAYEYWRVDMNDPTGAGFIGIGRMGLCEVYKASRNFRDGWRMDPVSTTRMKRSTSGQRKSARIGTSFKRATMDFANLSEAEKWYLLDRFMTVGESTPFFIAMHLGGASEPWTTLYGQLVGLPGITVNGPNRNDIRKLVFEEQA